MEESKLNAKQLKVVEFLRAHKGQEFTLSEIKEGAKLDSLKSGTTNSLIGKYITCNKDAQVVICECCGHKTKVSTYGAI